MRRAVAEWTTAELPGRRKALRIEAAMPRLSWSMVERSWGTTADKASKRERDGVVETRGWTTERAFRRATFLATGSAVRGGKTGRLTVLAESPEPMGTET